MDRGPEPTYRDRRRMTDAYLLQPADLEWEQGTPVSRLYRDIYWQRSTSLQEKKAVFVDQALARGTGADTFTIAELGFGFGLNCLLTAEHWPPDCRLNLVSIEKHPVPHQVLEQYLAPLDFRYRDALLTQYPPPYRGQHVIWLSAQIRLLLIFDDVARALGNLDAAIDFWYLDGFAPARNPDMWSEEVCRQMFARSRAGAGVATYSAASAVRHGLQAAGFEVTRKPGFGQKKEMLAAVRPGDCGPAPMNFGDVLIIGGGLAGRYCAEALQKRGIPFTLADGGDGGPSTIPQLAMFPQLALAAETRYRFSVAASQYMQTSTAFHRSGLRWFGRTPEETARLGQIEKLFTDDLIEAQEDDTFLFHQAGWLAPQELPSVAVTPQQVISLTPAAGGWLCNTASGRQLEAAHVIVATGGNRDLLPEQLQVRAIRGQAISVGTEGVQQVLNGAATLFPTYQGRSVISGTYARSTSLDPDPADTEQLLALASPYGAFDRSDVRTFVGIRAASRDRLPIVGQAPDWTAVEQINRLSALDAFQPGLHYCTAFGSRGATHARLCAEHLVSKLAGEPAALGLREQAMLSPARFRFRTRTPGR